MATDSDDDALTWAGESDPSHVAGPDRAAVESAPVTTVIVDAEPRSQTSSVLLVVYGILTGGYLIYTFGWFVAVQRYNTITAASSDVLTSIMFGLTEVLAVASPALWLAAAIALTRRSKPGRRLVWILVGLLAVIPWPFVLGAWNS